MGRQRIAVRENGVLSYLLTDHLGSTTVTVDSVTLAKTGELRYSSWGETRYSEGTTPTNRRYTGQYEEASLGLLFFNARWVDRSWGGLLARIRSFLSREIQVIGTGMRLSGIILSDTVTTVAIVTTD